MKDLIKKNKKISSLESLLLFIEKDSEGKELVNLSKYKKNILNTISEQILKKVKKEDIKDLADKNNENEKRAWKNQKNTIKWSFLFIATTLFYMTCIFDSEYESVNIILMFFLFLSVLSSLSVSSYIKCIYQEFILNRDLRKNKKTILLKTNLKQEINNVFESIKITKKDTIKNEMLSYILEDINIKKIENKIQNKIIYQHKKDIENKIIKIGIKDEL